MRLINTTTLDLEDFTGPRPPSYVVLSHTWGDEEVSLHDWYNRGGPSSAISSKRGYAKILNCCRTAREDGYRYVWIDTCCIDKTSSAELTESTDVPLVQSGPSMLRLPDRLRHLGFVLLPWCESLSLVQKGLDPARAHRASSCPILRHELAVPGARDERYKELEAITGIDSPVLVAPGSPRYVAPYEYSVADRMSWAASRQTTRTEDTAYCLLGLFDVSLPLIYGEGVGAFRRLQEAIMKSNNDLSIQA